MSYNKKKFFLSKEIVTNFSGQILIKKKFMFKFIYKYYRLLIKHYLK